MMCEHPGCSFPARHHPNIGGEVVEGWQHLCCIHVDVFMAACAASVDPAEAAAGLVSWSAAHEAQCGPLEVPS